MRPITLAALALVLIATISPAQSGKRDAVFALIELGADPEIKDDLYTGNAIGWARAGGHEWLAEELRAAGH